VARSNATSNASSSETPSARPTLRPVPSAASEVEPIDLLEIAGVTALVRRYAPYVLSFAAGAILIWLFRGRRGR